MYWYGWCVVNEVQWGRLAKSCDLEELKKCLQNSEIESFKNSSPMHKIELLPNTKPTPPSIEKPPYLELKPLPPYLRYTYFSENQTLPVIILSKLSEEHESALVQLLKKRVQALGWHISDIKGISPLYCMHKILMEEGHKTTIKRQRRLNKYAGGS